MKDLAIIAAVAIVLILLMRSNRGATVLSPFTNGPTPGISITPKTNEGSLQLPAPQGGSGSGGVVINNYSPAIGSDIIDAPYDPTVTGSFSV